MKYGIISTDNHVMEPPGTYLDRLPLEFRELSPRIIRGQDGGDGWSYEGELPHQTFGSGAEMAGTSESFRGLTWEQIIPGNYDGQAHLHDMDIDGVDAVFVYPGTSPRTYSMKNRILAKACVRAYNDWLIEEFCSVDPDRLFPICLAPVEDGIEELVAEAERVIDKGARELFLPYFASVPYWSDLYDRFWQVAAEAQVPVTIHLEQGGNSPTPDASKGASPGEEADSLYVAGIIIRRFSALKPITQMIFSGVFDRFPDLVMVNAESNVGWVPFWVQFMDQEWARHRKSGWTRIAAQRAPHDYFGRNIFMTVLDDIVGFDIAKRDALLQNSAMYSTDYPHSITLWPRSREIIGELTAGMDADAKYKILAGNAVRAFNLRDD